MCSCSLHAAVHPPCIEGLAQLIVPCLSQQNDTATIETDPQSTVDGPVQRCETDYWDYHSAHYQFVLILNPNCT